MTILLAGCGDDGGGNAQAPMGGGPRAMPVTVTTVQAEEVLVRNNYAGRAHGARAVEVRARVGGILDERLYTEGQVVEQGTPLFRIDREPFEVALNRAEAERARAQAELEQARREWNRVSELYERNTTSARELDRARSAVELAEAAIRLADAGVAQARLDLGYTQVEAPLSGVTGLEATPEGSLVEPGSLLTIITQLDPIHVRFALPPALSSRSQDSEPMAATLILPDGNPHAHPGQVDFTNRTVDPTTGTIQARAVFPNPEHAVMPGQFVRIQLETQRIPEAFLIDPSAVIEGPTGPAVFVIGEGDVAQARPVTLGPIVEGRQVILEGLQNGDRLVINGQVALQDGAPVAITETQGGAG